ncbi:hypothetical protein D3C71_1910620 [compost metagenome]
MTTMTYAPMIALAVVLIAIIGIATFLILGRLRRERNRVILKTAEDKRRSGASGSPTK